MTGAARNLPGPGPGPDLAGPAGPGEATALRHIAERLAVEFPRIPAAEIDVAVHAEHERFDGSPVRDFVPILVERSVRRRFAPPTGLLR